MRELRLAAGAVQADVAYAAQRLGLSWVRSTVATIESGGRGLTAEELVLLPLVLTDALAREVMMADLVPDGPAELTAETVLDATTILAALAGRRLRPVYVAESGERFEGEPVARFLRSSEEDRNAAARLGTTPERVREAAMRLWGQSMLDERNDRASAENEPTDAANRQAVRGHITRTLLEELRAELARPTPPSRHVVPVAGNGGWQVVNPGGRRPSAVAATKAEAVRRARELVAKAGGGEVVVHSRSGRVTERNTVRPAGDEH